MVAPNFISFMLDVLSKYEDDENVYQISEYNFPINYSSSRDAYFLPITTSQGWATWKNKWDIIAWMIDDLNDYLSDTNNRLAFDLNGAYSYSSIAAATLSDHADSWGIRWYWQVYRRDEGSYTLISR